MRRVAGVVLAGGQSRRFGTDKAAAIYRGRALLDWSVEALLPHVELVLVSGPAHPRGECVADRPRSGLGPLGGLAGALHAAGKRGFTHLLSIPCDTPHVPPELLARLAGSPGAVYVEGCPVVGLWPVGLAARLERYLASGLSGAVRAWARTIGAQGLEAPDIANINSRADLAALGANDG